MGSDSQDDNEATGSNSAIGTEDEGDVRSDQDLPDGRDSGDASGSQSEGVTASPDQAKGNSDEGGDIEMAHDENKADGERFTQSLADKEASDEHNPGNNDSEGESDSSEAAAANSDDSDHDQADAETDDDDSDTDDGSDDDDDPRHPKGGGISNQMSDEEAKQVAEERERRLDPENRPANVEVDNTQRGWNNDEEDFQDNLDGNPPEWDKGDGAGKRREPEVWERLEKTEEGE